MLGSNYCVPPQNSRVSSNSVNSSSRTVNDLNKTRQNGERTQVQLVCVCVFFQTAERRIPPQPPAGRQLAAYRLPGRLQSATRVETWERKGEPSIQGILLIQIVDILCRASGTRSLVVWVILGVFTRVLQEYTPATAVRTKYGSSFAGGHSRRPRWLGRWSACLSR